MIIRTLKNIAPATRIGIKLIATQFSNQNNNNNDNNGFGRFKKKPAKKVQPIKINKKIQQKEQQKLSDKYKQKKIKDSEESNINHTNTNTINNNNNFQDEKMKEDKQKIQSMKATGFSKFLKKKVQEKPKIQKQNQQAKQDPMFNTKNKETVENFNHQQKQSIQKSEKKNLETNKVQKVPGFQNFVKKSPQKVQSSSKLQKNQKQFHFISQMTAKGFQNFKKYPPNFVKQNISKQQQQQKKKSQDSLKQENNFTQQQKIRKKKQEDIKQGQQFFRQQLKKVKDAMKQKQNLQKEQNQIDNQKPQIQKRLGQIFKKIKEDKKKIKQGKQQIPNWINQNSTLLIFYLLFRSMRPWGVMLFAVGVLWLYKIFQNRQASQQVQNDFLIQKLKQNKIIQTWLQKITHHAGQQSDDKQQLFVLIKCQDGKTYKCLSNDDFQNMWKNLIGSHNTQAATIGLKKPILIKPSIHNSPMNYMETLRSALSIFLTVMIVRSIFRGNSQMKKGNKGGFDGGNPLDIFGNKKSKRFKQNVNVKFNDVMGMQKAKEEIVEFIDFLKNPQKYNRLGAKIPRGALLTGPPGTGKTMIAKACAGESQVPFFTISGSQFIQMYVGVGAQRVRDLFKQAKQSAPSIIFIDQIDAVGKKRATGIGGGGNDQRDTTLNQLLVEMDGFDTNTNVIVFAATNQKQVLDPALTRPGRFDRLVEVDLPDLQGRKQIFMVHLKPIVLNQKYDIQEYAKRMATLTPGFSGADIKNLCNQAAIIAARGQKTQVSLIDFQLATQRIIGGVQKKSTLITPQTRKTVAYHQCGHGVVSWFLQGANPLLKLTIIPRSKGALGFAQYLPNQNQISTKMQLQDQICVILGGRICQQIFFNKVSTGAYDDLQKAYHFTKQIIATHGMSQQLGWLTFEQTQYAKQYSHYTEAKIDKQILHIIKKCSQRTRKLILQKKNQIDNLAKCLLQKQTIDQNTIEQILGERPFRASKQYQDYLKEKRRVIEVQLT